MRFMQKGTTRFYFVPTIASASLIPTALEVTAGTRLDTELAEVAGFAFSNSEIATPDMSSTFTGNIPGEDVAEKSTLTFYEHKAPATNPIRTALAKGTAGYIVIFFGGIAGAAPAAADKCDVWPITVASNVRGYSAGNESSRYVVTFTMSSVPGFDKALT
jgi:hypothetical protein